MRLRVALALATALAILAPTQASALTPRIITGPYVSGWFGYWEPDSAVQSLADSGTSSVPEVNIFWWGFDGPSIPLCTFERDGTCTDDTVAPWTNPRLSAQRQILQDAGIRVLGSIVDETRAGTLSTYLATAESRAAYAELIADWAAKAQLDGVDLDMEKFAFADGKATWATTKPRWVAFIRALSKSLHDRGLLLSATVPAGAYPFIGKTTRVTDDCGDPLGPEGSPNPGTGYCVYAWREIIGSVDRLRIMAYDYSYDVPGPIGPLPWAEQVVASALLQVGRANRAKVWLGIPQYARNWVRQYPDGSYITRGECPTGWKPDSGAAGIPGMLSQSISRAEFIAEREQVTPTWSDQFGEYTFRYWYPYDGVDPQGAPVQCDAEREVWFADTRSAELKADIVDRTGIGGLAVWEFGFVRDGFYSRMAQKIAPPLELTASSPSKVRQGKQVTVTGRVLRGELGVSGAQIRVSWVSPKGKVKSLGTTRTSAKGAFTLRVIPPSSGSLRIVSTDQGQTASTDRRIVVVK